MAKSEPFTTAWCAFNPHTEPQENCPVVIKHDRSPRVWVCTCKCHAGQDVAALLDEKQSPVHHSVQLVVALDVDSDAWREIWGNSIAEELADALDRYVVVP